MTLSKRNLLGWGLIVGALFLVAFITGLFFSGAIHAVLWTIGWVMGVVVGILIIIEFVARKEQDILYLIGGIFLIIFPIIGAILLLIDHLMVKK